MKTGLVETANDSQSISVSGTSAAIVLPFFVMTRGSPPSNSRMWLESERRAFLTSTVFTKMWHGRLARGSLRIMGEAPMPQYGGLVTIQSLPYVIRPRRPSQVPLQLLPLNLL